MSRPQIDRHHVFYERGLYQRDPIMFRLRSMPGLIIPMNIPDHRALHRRLDNWSNRPTVPQPDYDATLYFITEVSLPYRSDMPRLQTLEQAIGWFSLTNNESTAEHLYAQKEFILNTEMYEDYDGKR